VLTVKEVAAKLRLSLSKTYALLDSGMLGYYQLDGSKRVSEDQLQRFLEASEKRERGHISPDRRQQPRPRLSHIKL
jgi:excisionase family DNA binding protein